MHAGVDGEAVDLSPPLEFEVVPAALRVRIPALQSRSRLLRGQAPLPRTRKPGDEPADSYVRAFLAGEGQRERRGGDGRGGSGNVQPGIGLAATRDMVRS